MKEKLIKNKKNILIIVFLLICIVSYSQPTKEDEKTKEENKKVENIGKKQINFNYVEDEIVDNFITNYNSISKSPIENIKPGNIKTKYHFDTYGYYLTAINIEEAYAEGKIEITIEKTYEKNAENMSEMKKIFYDCIKALDSSVESEKINSFFDQLVLNEFMKDEEFENFNISYFPNVKQTRTRSKSRNKYNSNEQEYYIKGGHIKITKK